ncbi:hypothetical protein ACP4OV_023046 [Aristida adscensionis]
MQYTLPLLNMQAPTTQSISSKPPHHHHQQQQLMRTVSISILVMSLPVLYVSFLHVPPASLFRDTTFWFLMSNSIIIVIAADSGMLFFRSSPSSCSSVDVAAADGSLTFAVPGDGELANGKNGHASDEVEVVKNQALVVTEHGEQTATIADGDHAYALVVRDERVMASTPERKEIILSPSAAAAVESMRPPRLTASRSLAREERMARRRYGHRPSPSSPSHSRALVPVQEKRVVVSEEKPFRRTATVGRPSPAAAAVEEERESEYSRLTDEELNRRVEEFIAKFNREMRLQLEKEQAALVHASIVHA